MASDEPAHRAAPVFPLTDDQRASLAAFAATDRSALSRDEPSEFATRQYVAMRCANCHARDGVEPALVTTLATEFDASYAKHFAAAQLGAGAEAGVYLAPDQKRFPLLTWAGEKLRGEWSTSFIAGDMKYKPRPYLRARMPAFKTRAAGFAAGFAAQHGRPLSTESDEAVDAKLVPLGAKLVSTVGGFSCVQCHADSGKPPLAPFEAPALDFAYITQRLRKDYYHRWMQNPMSLDPTTKMPRFSDDDDQTALRETLDGDATRQFGAIWHYLLQQDPSQRSQ